jgi:hypothetical protein
MFKYPSIYPSFGTGIANTGKDQNAKFKDETACSMFASHGQQAGCMRVDRRPGQELLWLTTGLKIVHVR